jgi:hypothetical protein
MILLSSFRLEFLGQTTSDILALPFEVTAYFESKAAQQTEPRDDSVSPLIVRYYHHKDFVNDTISAHFEPSANTVSSIIEHVSIISLLDRVQISIC